MPDRASDVRRIVTGGRARGLSDDQIRALVARYDERVRVKTASPPAADTPGMMRRATEAVGDVGVGLAKSAAGTVIGLGDMLASPMRTVPGVRDYVGTPEDFAAARETFTAPTSTAQQVGKTVGDVAQFFTPAGAAGKLKAAANIGRDVLLTGAQGGTAGEAVASGAVSAVVPGAGALKKGAEALKASANPLVRAAIKPTVTSLRRISGGGGLDAKAERLVSFIVDNKLTTANKARDLFMKAEKELQGLLAKAGAKTDAATRAERYLLALERSAAKQGLPASDVAQIRNAAAELLQGPMGEDVVTMVSKAHPALVDQFGKPIQVLVPQTTRHLRAAVPADEALSSARSSSRWSTNKQWGEQKGTAVESQKAVERAQRDAAKVAVPAARDLLHTESMALKSEEVLDRMAQRAGNRDAVSLPAHVIGAGEIATGRVPVLAFAANWLRNNQLKAGVWAKSLGDAIEAGNAGKVAFILERLGIAGASQMMRTPATAQ